MPMNVDVERLAAELLEREAGDLATTAAIALLRDSGTLRKLAPFVRYDNGGDTSWIDWKAVNEELQRHRATTPGLDFSPSRLVLSGGERAVIEVAASLAAAYPVNLRDALTTVDASNHALILTAVMGTREGRFDVRDLAPRDQAIQRCWTLVGEWSSVPEMEAAASALEAALTGTYEENDRD